MAPVGTGGIAVDDASQETAAAEWVLPPPSRAFAPPHAKISPMPRCHYRRHSLSDCGAETVTAIGPYPSADTRETSVACLIPPAALPRRGWWRRSLGEGGGAVRNKRAATVALPPPGAICANNRFERLQRPRCGRGAPPPAPYPRTSNRSRADGSVFWSAHDNGCARIEF